MRTIAVLFCSFGMVFLSRAADPAAAPRTIQHNLVSVLVVQPAPLQEIRYATPHNFTGKQLYPFAAAFIHKDLAGPLRKVQQELSRQGMGLKIYDGYRPLSIQQRMWNLIRDERYVSAGTRAGLRWTSRS